ncbi:MAG: SLC13/DASS family transporter [Firmicutes bacterium]|nr:SLC13/DASS family transporter [Bacillota bacterium]
MAASTMTIIVLVVALIFYALEIFPIGVTSVGICVVLALTKTISVTDAFSGFSSDVVLLVAGMMVVGGAMFQTGVAPAIGRTIVRLAGDKQLTVMAAILCTTAGLSAFLSNTACTAMFIPVIAGIAATSARKFSGKYVYMPLSWAANVGGMITLVGSTPQLVAQGVITKAGVAPYSMFEFVPIGLPLTIATLLYACTIGYKIAQKIFAKEIEAFMAEEEAAVTTEVVSAQSKAIDSKAWIAGGTMLLMVVLFVTQPFHKFPVGLLAMLGAFIVVATGCLTEEQAYRSVSWSTICVMAGAMGLATALEKTGAGKIIADTVLSWLGTAATPFTIFAVMTALAAALTQVMSCTGVSAMLTPIALFMCKSMGIDPHGVIMGVIIGSSIAIMTPIGSAPTAMVLGPGKYHFMDYVKTGTPITIVLYVLSIILIPMFYPM